MPQLILSDASLAYGHVPLLDHADFQLDPGERVAVIGRNGTGKSSLLRALAGQGALDDGTVWRQPGMRLGYVPQEPPFDSELTVFEAVVAGMGEVSALLAEYHAVSLAMADDSADHDLLLERMNRLQGELESRHAWSFETQAERVIQRFSLDPDARVGTLSGGQKKRLALAQALAVSPELLLLDEPTNHLDIGAIEWLEEMLVSSSISLVFITHDRRFLDRVSTRIVELDRGRLLSCPGNFSAYQTRKASILHDEAIQNAKFDKFLAQEEVWIRKGVEARRTRNEGRVLRLEQLRRERAARRDRQGKVELALDAGDKSGKLVAELEGVSKSFGKGKQTLAVVRDFSCRLQRGDKIGLIGPNGAGKTTLLRLILGELAPDSGRVHLGTKIQTAYFDQFRTQLDEEAALVDVISPGSDYVEIGNEKKHVIGYLGDFLFPPQRARSPVKSLSGGERNRLLLARLFARPANVLVLDEPTNDLDIETLELLEQLLQDYAGTLFLVSHDRAFIDNVVTQTIAYEGDGTWREYAGGYQDWADFQARRRAEESVQQRVKHDAPVAAQAPRSKADGSRKHSYKESRELAELPGRIAALEQEQSVINQRLEDATIYRTDPQEAQRISLRLTQIDDELMHLLERWEALEQ
ncbi:ATP-binding cassette domain-containing protein [Propionivibrio sp.]|uniref:ATP-binding cassette domain-containing protein n=1 Tax=Propionivibrio sp. TaxID=2212460 RepID=UPI0025F260EF|nr:ATP-binding cassette domain-containing protein [Propionivibrio sp.]MBK7355981.1 ATP-binding cassette domain-containing protein [Propionivibrio sp.]MBK8400355.1 ATP-binding cassette domain-containing protein [Propionivibrio sp.]MBK8743940.1 ATP-binding cassette domain-containing protein [Propionivibrio sp.]MBK8892942.1 ATP-binding cassette domain-containing protein [Propionivibrio sp.]MBL0207371.1 ATP-binding cassette domain-containing protein [Propionivibrio sp.]